MLAQQLAIRFSLLGTLAALAIVPYRDINPTIAGTLSLLEAVWILVNGSGAMYAAFNFSQSYAECQAVKLSRDSDPVDVIVAKRDRRSDGIILFKQGAYLCIGVLAALTPPPATRAVQDLAYVTTLLVFIVGSALLSLLSYTSAKDRRTVRKLVLQRRLEDLMGVPPNGNVVAPARELRLQRAEKDAEAMRSELRPRHTSEAANVPPEPSQGHTEDTGEPTRDLSGRGYDD